MSANKKILFLFCIGCVLLFNAAALDFQQKGNRLIFRCKETEVQLCNARITGIKNIKSGVVLAGNKTANTAKTAGLGNMKNQAKAMSHMHAPWGEPSQKLHRPPIKDTTLYRYPDSRSKLAIQKQKQKITAVWTGLTDSKKFYPADFIKLEFSEDANGALTIKSSGKTADKSVFSISVPIENLNGKGKFILPSFGGLEYAASGTPGFFRFQDTGLFYEAKFMAYEFNDTALGYWYEDPSFRPYYAMFERGKNASAFGIEINNIMPFEQHDKISSPALKIATFADAGWIAAARPYRNWYHKTFAEDIARRDSFKWANKIAAICDPGVGNEAAMKKIKELMPTEKILLHVWQARELGFTTNVPDYTLRDSYPAEVARAHKYGFKVMCYVCSLCAVYKSPAWEKDNVGSFFLTRKNNINNYGGNKNAFDENLVGTLTAAKGKDQFANLKKGAFLYCDPLSRLWREYFSQLTAEVNRKSETDANYQDTLGCTSDNGNGIVEGLSGAQGNEALARLLAKSPGVPMASEYGPEPIAFAVKWPLNYPQVWGNMDFRKYRIHHHYPLSAFLFGYRTWIPTVNAFDDFHKHLLTACSDALGGLGLFAPSTELDIRKGFSDHLVLRTKLFVDKELVPYFPERKFPKNIRAMFKGIDGIYSYYDDGKLQMMLSPEGKPLYGRVHNVSSIKAEGLVIPHWPASENGTVYGLNPESSYALYPAASVPEISIGRLPENVRVRFCYTAPEYAYLELDGKGKIILPIKKSAKFKKMYVNNQPVTGSRISGTLPLRIFLSTGKEVKPEKIARINIISGIADSNFLPLPALRIKRHGQTMYQLHGYNSTFLDSVFEVKNSDDAVEFLLQNTQKTDGNGVILSLHINGLETAKFDCKTGGKIMDTQLRQWRVPLGKFKGQHVLISIRADNKSSSVRDQQYVSLPRLVQDKEQKFAEKVLQQ